MLHKESRRQFLKESLVLGFGIATSRLYTTEHEPFIAPILDIISRPDKAVFAHPKIIPYELQALSVWKEPVTILQASSILFTRPVSDNEHTSFHLSSWEGKTLTCFEHLELSEIIPYDTALENHVATQVITLEVIIHAKKPETRILTGRNEIVFGNPPMPVRGTWPVTGTIAALEWYEIDGNQAGIHSVWQKEYPGAYGTAVDIKAPLGTPVYAPFEGTMTTMSDYLSPSYGNQVVLTTPEGFDVSFAHLSAFWDGTDHAGITKEVKPGDLVGFVGRTGQVPVQYVHLHYEVHGIKGNIGIGNYLRIYDILPQHPTPEIGMKVQPGN